MTHSSAAPHGSNRSSVSRLFVGDPVSLRKYRGVWVVAEIMFEEAGSLRDKPYLVRSLDVASPNRLGRDAFIWIWAAEDDLTRLPSSVVTPLVTHIKCQHDHVGLLKHAFIQGQRFPEADMMNQTFTRFASWLVNRGAIVAPDVSVQIADRNSSGPVETTTLGALIAREKQEDDEWNQIEAVKAARRQAHSPRATG